MTQDSPEAAYREVADMYAQAAIVNSINAILQWDEETKAPPAAGAYRAQQVEWTARTLHRLRTNPRLGELLEQLGESDLATTTGPNQRLTDEAATIAVWRHEYDRQTKRPEDLVGEISKQSILGQHAWIEARKEDNFSKFAPHLETMIRLKREEADALGFEGERYDALLEDYEPGVSTAEVERVLADLEAKLVPLVQELVSSARRPDPSITRKTMKTSAQEVVGRLAAEAVGFDFQRGRLDESAHPFSTELGPNDCRITTRYDEQFFPSAFFATLHEAGHGMYEQGLRTEHYGMPLGTYASLGIHESQSRLWENFVGRSRAFWEYFYPHLLEHHTQIADVSLDEFFFAVNDVKPSLIRVEADEATYNLHIIIRFNLERRLLNGELEVADLPTAWNEAYESRLGIRPPSDADGVMQDVHWSAGLLGYFPTYSLGNLYGAQLFAAAAEEIGNLDAQFRQGEFAPLLEWMQTNVHSAGRRMGAIELVEQATGQTPDSEFLMKHLRSKLEPLYL